MVLKDVILSKNTGHILVMAVLLIVAGVGSRMLFRTEAPHMICADEEAHSNYAKYIADVGETPDYAFSWWATNFRREADLKGVVGLDRPLLPAEIEILESKDPKLLGFSYENYQQPGFYYLASIFVPSVFSMRVLSMCLFMGGLLILLVANPSRWLEIVIFSLLPGFFFVSSMVTNSSLLFFGCCLLAYAIDEEKIGWFAVAGLILVFSKITGIAIMLAVSVWYIAKFIQSKKSPNTIFAVVGVLVAGIGLSVAMSRMHLHSVNSWAVNFNHPIELLATTGITGLWHPLAEMPQGGLFIGALGFLALGMGIFGLATMWVVRRIREIKVFNPQVFAAFAVIGMWFLFSVTHPHWQGRLLYAAFPFLVMGYRRLDSYEF